MTASATLSDAVKFGLVSLSAVVWLGLDILTKHLALRYLADGPNHILGPLYLRLTRNSGLAFGLGAGLGAWLSLVVLVVIGALFAYTRQVNNRFVLVLLGLVFGGALGNLVDRIFRASDGWFSGRVVDFIDLSHWPVFNVADAGIVVGVFGMVIWGIGKLETNSS